MRCLVCDHRPWGMDLFGGGYWHKRNGEALCFSCAVWFDLVTRYRWAGG